MQPHDHHEHGHDHAHHHESHNESHDKHGHGHTHGIVDASITTSALATSARFSRLVDFREVLALVIERLHVEVAVVLRPVVAIYAHKAQAALQVRNRI